MLSAEAEGFEPSVQLPVRQFSKLVVSATHPSFLVGLITKSGANIQLIFNLSNKNIEIYSNILTFVMFCMK